MRPSAMGHQRVFNLPALVADTARELGRAEGATLYMTLLAAFATLLHRLTGRDDVVVGSPVAGRCRTELEPLIGPFMNTLLLRTDLSGNPSFRQLLGRVRDAALGAFAHQDVPFDRVVAELHPDRAGGEAALFHVAFGVHNAPSSPLRLAGLTLESLQPERMLVRYDLTVWVQEAAGELQVLWTWRVALFDETTVARWASWYAALLRSALRTPDARLDRLKLRSEADIRKDEERRATIKRSNRGRFRRRGQGGNNDDL
jgi:non-ribosomal peptide synthetase component F